MEERISDFEHAVRVFEKQFNCRLCCHDYSGQLQNVPLPHYHLNVFCTRLKERRAKLTELCIGFDRDQVQRCLMEHGMLDMVVDRRQMRQTVIRLIGMLRNPHPAIEPLPFLRKAEETK